MKNISSSKGKICVNIEAFRKKHKRKIVRRGIFGVILAVPLVYAVGKHLSLQSISFNDNELNTIVEHYDNQEITIVCLSDSQSINLNPCFYEPNFPEYIENSLESKGASVQLIDTSSLKLNKTYHITETLENNLSCEEIKTINQYAARAAVSKVLSDIGCPIDLGFLGTLFADSVEKGDDSVYISTELQSSKEPIVFYSSGANDLMRELNCSPMSIKKYNDDGTIRDQYLYAAYKSKDSNTLEKVIGQVEENFKKIYAINKNSRVFALSLYIPNSLNNEDMQPFVDLINSYNKELEELCKTYGVVYVSVEELAAVFLGNVNFHISEKGHKILADLLVGKISESCSNDQLNCMDVTATSSFTTQGLSGFYEGLQQEKDSWQLESFDEINSDYQLKAYENRQKEIQEEMEIVDIVKKKLKK